GAGGRGGGRSRDPRRPHGDRAAHPHLLPPAHGREPAGGDRPAPGGARLRAHAGAYLPRAGRRAGPGDSLLRPPRGAGERERDARRPRGGLARARADPGRGRGPGVRRAHAAAKALWRRVRAWRRIHFTAGGVAFTVGTFAVGFAALNTGNNLLYLLLGSMLGFIAVSGWLSEQAIRGLVVERRVPRAVTVERDLVLTYQVRNEKKRLPSLAVEIHERGLPEPAFLAHVPAGGRATI